MYQVIHIGYCGMRTFDEKFESRDEAVRATASLIESKEKKGLEVVNIEVGQEWEVLGPENAAMVPDDCGIIKLERITFECGECGSEYDTQDEVYTCCNSHDC